MNTAFYHLWLARRLQHILLDSDLASVIHFSVTSQLDFRNAIYLGPYLSASFACGDYVTGKESMGNPVLAFPVQYSHSGAWVIRVDGPTNSALEYEIVQVVDTGPILRDMAFSVDHEHLYIMSEKQANHKALENKREVSRVILPPPASARGRAGHGH
ncbi:hypothetical protein KIL84_019277 [Mauremys mutica]|uniref:Uncharacterized protein n=1 Tax=Mauremys mutica TaxID=74926 RepID=A0A9D3XUT8_9SAUR|nr:hypothetical protein KIL84_019277 [Mauremys mutica]